jgi:hypothetical protein
MERRRWKLVTRHHLEVWDGARWVTVALFENPDLQRAKRIAIEEALAPVTEDLPARTFPTETTSRVSSPDVGSAEDDSGGRERSSAELSEEDAQHSDDR